MVLSTISSSILSIPYYVYYYYDYYYCCSNVLLLCFSLTFIIFYWDGKFEISAGGGFEVEAGGPPSAPRKASLSISGVFINRKKLYNF